VHFCNLERAPEHLLFIMADAHLLDILNVLPRILPRLDFSLACFVRSGRILTFLLLTGCLCTRLWFYRHCLPLATNLRYRLYARFSGRPCPYAHRLRWRAHRQQNDCLFGLHGVVSLYRQHAPAIPSALQVRITRHCAGVSPGRSGRTKAAAPPHRAYLAAIYSYRLPMTLADT